MTRKFFVLLIFLCLPLVSLADGALTERTYKRLAKIHQLMGDDHYADALKRLDSLLPATKKRPYEHAVILQTYGYVYAGQGKYKQAVDAFERCLALKAMPEGVQQSMEYNLSQMYAAIPDYTGARDHLEVWLKTATNPDPVALAYAATVYAQLQEFAKAIPFIQQAISKSSQPPESWYQLLVAMHYSRKEYKAAAKVLTALVNLYPGKKQYWDQLTGVYYALKNDKKTLAVSELAYKAGHLTSDKELMNLVNLYLLVDIPYTAARLLEKEMEASRISRNMKNVEKLGETWLRAKEYEKAATALQDAAVLGGGGEVYMKAAQVYLEQDNWKKALATIRKALNAGGLKDTGTAWLIQGMGQYELKNREKALISFKNAGKYPKVSSQANDWIAYINGEIAAEKIDHELKKKNSS